MSASFDLTKNPFAVLAVSPRANSAVLADAKADRLFDSEHDEAVLEAAHSDLIVERNRLAHELSWLSDTAPNRAQETVGKLATLQPSKAIELLQDGGQLSRLNLAADLLRRFQPELTCAQPLLSAYEEVDWSSVRQTIDEARALSGFGPTRDASWKKALSDLIDRHAAVLIEAITGNEDGPDLLASMLSERGASANERSHGLLEKAVSQYDRWSIPRLERVSEQIDDSLARLKSVDNPEKELSNLERLLADWDRLSQPVQLRDQAKGLDEPRSLRLFKKVREVAIWFANDRENPNAAHRITEAFARAFCELPTVAAMTAADLETLTENIEVAKIEKIVEPLRVAADAAIESLAATARQIKAGGFRAGSTGFAGTLFDSFEKAKSNASALSDSGLPWFVVRSVALALNNDQSDRLAATTLINAIIDTAPSSPRKRLEDDLKALRSAELQEKFSGALESGDLRRARDMVESLIEASPEERSELLAVRDKLDSRLRMRNWKRVGWAIAAAVFAIAMYNEDGSQTDFDSSASAYPNELQDTVSADVDTSTVDQTEEPPPMYNLSPLTLPQLRFCRFESVRLEQLENQVDSSVVTDFNAMVQNYNDRCGSYRYDESDMATIDAEVVARADRISAETAKLLAKWRLASRPSVIAEPSSSANTESFSLPDSSVGAPSIAGVPPEEDPLASEFNGNGQ